MNNADDVKDEVICGFKVSANRKLLWIKELRLLDTFTNICQEINVKYFLSFGSCIGAVRHKGFIPWDDDIDIGMLREDFEIFLKEGLNRFPDDIAIQFGVSEHGVDNLLRIRDNNTTGITSREITAKGSKGVFIEIYCFDYVNDNLCRKMQISILRILNRIIIKHTLKENIRKHKKHLFGLIPLISAERLWRIFNAICRFQNKSKCEYLDIPIIPGYAKTREYLVRKEDVIDTIRVPFEYTYSYIPKGYDGFLTALYGNYMELPPIENRGNHHDCVVFYDPNMPYTEYENSSDVFAFFNGDYTKSLL